VIVSRNGFLSNLVALSEAMLEHGRQGHWDDVERLESVRREGLEAFFATAPVVAEIDFIRQDLQRMLVLDQELSLLVSAARDGAGEQLREIRAGRRAQAAYAANG
jgi:hypothetical protein